MEGNSSLPLMPLRGTEHPADNTQRRPSVMPVVYTGGAAD